MKALDYDGLDHVVDKIYDLINSGGSADYIVEEGTSGIWTYRKWASGIAECWGDTSYNVTTWSAWGSFYEGNPAQKLSYPSGLFSETPICCSSASGKGGVAISHMEVSTDGTKDQTPNLRAIRPGAWGTPTLINYSVEAKGLWKEFTPSVMKQGQSLRTWNFTPVSGVSVASNGNGVVVRNGIAMGTLILNGVSGTANTYRQIGTTTDKPKCDYVLFDVYRGTDAQLEGVIRITNSGSVDFNSVRGVTNSSEYLQLVYVLAD